MNVSVDGANVATWSVSTARPGYRTPLGTYVPYSLERMHYSKLYDDTPMPYSIFFHAGYAIHGTYGIRNLGRPISQRSLFELIRAQGRQSTTIEIDR